MYRGITAKKSGATLHLPGLCPLPPINLATLEVPQGAALVRAALCSSHAAPYLCAGFTLAGGGGFKPMHLSAGRYLRSTHGGPEAPIRAACRAALAMMHTQHPGPAPLQGRF